MKDICPGQLRVWRETSSDYDNEPIYFLVIRKREHEFDEEAWYTYEDGGIEWEWTATILSHSEPVDVKS